MLGLITEKESRIRLLEAGHSDHLKDCKTYREETKKTIAAMQETMNVGFLAIANKMEKSATDRMALHKSNTRWLIGIFITAMLGLLGAIGSLTFFIAEHSNAGPQVSAQFSYPAYPKPPGIRR